MQIISDSELSFSQLVDQIPRFESTPEIRVECADEEKFAIVEQLVDRFAVYEINTIDGVRVQFEDGWGLVRASNTQPVLVLRFEAVSKSALRRIMQLFSAELGRFSAVKIAPEDFTI